jgi:hypothetical protein
MDYVLTCILVIVVSMFTALSREFRQKYLYSPNNLITDFTNLSNRIFLYVYKITTVPMKLPHGVKINITCIRVFLSVPVAARSKAWVCGRLLGGISVSNLAGGECLL